MADRLESVSNHDSTTLDFLQKNIIDFFQNAPIGIHSLSDKGIILWANDAELKSLGYSAEEYIGHSVTEFLFPGQEEHLMETMGKFVSGNSQSNKFKFLHKNGDAVYLTIDSNVKLCENGETFRYTRCFTRNDTDRRLEEELLEVQNKINKENAKAKAIFIRNVFHEVRTPLHALSSFFSNPNPLREEFVEMKHHTDAILGIVDDLTFSTAFESGEVSPLYPVPQHLPSVLAQVVDAVNSVEQKAGGTVGIKLHCEEVSRDAEEVIADPFFRRVLFSLLSNAVKFSPLNGVVDVTVSYIPTLIAGSAPHLDNENNIARSTSSATRRADVNMSPFFSSRSRLPDRVLPVPAVNEKDYSSEGTAFPPRGTFTFHIRNSTTIPMNLSHVRHFFKYYYHPDSSPSGDGGHVNMNVNTANRVTAAATMPIAPCAATTADNPAPVAATSTSNTSFNDLHQYSGLGLGLYTAYNMVTLMGGTLECSVENDNEACFWFTIPSTSASTLSLQSITPHSEDAFLEPSESSLSLDLLMAVADESANGRRLFHTTQPIEPFPSFAFLTERGQRTTAHSSLSEIATSVSSGKSERRSEIRVLVVDDSRICQKVALRALSGLEFVVELAGNGLEACRLLSEKPLRFDIVLMDLRMPVMDGLTAIRRCRAELGLTKLPIVALTAEVGASIRDEAMNAGANWFLTKPAKSQMLVSVLRTMTATSDQLNDNSCNVV